MLYVVKGFLSAKIVCSVKYTDRRLTLKYEYLYLRESFIIFLKAFHGYNRIENVFRITNCKLFRNSN